MMETTSLPEVGEMVEMVLLSEDGNEAVFPLSIHKVTGTYIELEDGWRFTHSGSLLTGQIPEGYAQGHWQRRNSTAKPTSATASPRSIQEYKQLLENMLKELKSIRNANR